MFGSYNENTSSEGGSNSVTNYGNVTSSVFGSYNAGTNSSGGGNTVVNHGTIGSNLYGSYNSGAGSSGGGNTVINAGTVLGSMYGAYNFSASSSSSGNVVINSGSVTGSIYGSKNNGASTGGADVITNSGSVGGDIKAGDGDDRVNLASGSNVTGVVDGETGNDTLGFSSMGSVDSSLWETKFLSFEALAFYDGQTTLTGTWDVSVPATVESGGEFILDGSASFAGNALTVNSGGQATVNGKLAVNSFDIESGGAADVNGTAKVAGATVVGGSLKVNTSGTLTSRTLRINDSGSVNIAGTANVQGAADVYGKLDFAYSGILNSGMLSVYQGGEVQVVRDANLGAASVGVQLRGGTLKAGDSFTLTHPLVVHAGGGAVDNNGYALTLGGTLTGDGPLTFTGPAATTLSGDGSGYGGQASLTSGKLVVSQGAVLGGSLTVSRDAILGGYGTLGELTNNGTLSPGGSIGTLTVNGNYAQGQTASYYQEISPDGTGDLLHVGGSATLSGGALVLNAPDRTFYRTGATWSMIQADGGLSGAFSSISQPFTSPTLFLLPQYTADGVAITAARLPYATYAADGRAAAVGQGLNAAAYGASADIEELLTTLDFSSGPVISSALSQLSPEPYDVFTQSGFDAGQVLTAAQRLGVHGGEGGAFHSPVEAGPAQLSALGGTNAVSGLSAGGSNSPENEFGESRFRFFLKPFGMLAGQQADGERTGYRSSLGGLTGGLAFTPAPGLTLALAPAYASRNLTLETAAGGWGRAQGASLALAGAWRREDFFADAVLRGGLDWYSSSRNVALPTGSFTAKADWMGWNAAASLGGGYDFHAGEATFGPIATASWQRISQDGFSEYGAGGFGLNVRQRADQTLNTTLGGRAFTTFKTACGALTPELRVAWGAQWLGAARAIGASFDGTGASGFTTKTADQGYHSAIVDFGMDMAMNERLSASARIGLEFFRPGYQSQAASLGLRYSF